MHYAEGWIHGNQELDLSHYSYSVTTSYQHFGCGTMPCPTIGYHEQCVSLLSEQYFTPSPNHSTSFDGTSRAVPSPDRFILQGRSGTLQVQLLFVGTLGTYLGVGSMYLMAPVDVTVAPSVCRLSCRRTKRVLAKTLQETQPTVNAPLGPAGSFVLLTKCLLNTLPHRRNSARVG